MSETTETTVPPGGGEAASEPAPAETTAPVEQEGGATETAETEQQTAEKAEKALQRRLAKLTARVSASDQRREQLEAEVAALRGGGAQQQQAWPQTPEELERLVDARAEAKAAVAAQEARGKAFYAAGEAAYADWTERCQNLMQMGADGPFSQLLVELPNGHQIAAALADDPEQLQRIVSLKTERGRAIELGKFAAKVVEATPAAAPRRPVSRAPAPIRPLGSGTANPVFNEYTETDPNALTQFYMRQAQEKRAKGIP